MPLQFILGRSGSGKSEYCLNRAVSCEEQGKRVIILVPEQYSHQGESALLRKKGYIHDGFTATSFGRLARKMIASSGLAYAPADSAGKAMLVLKALLNCRADLAYFSGCLEKSGYISLFMDMISELKKGQVTSDALREAAAKTSDHLFSLRLLDLACVYDAYNKLLGENLCDSDDDLSVLADILLETGALKDTAIFIDAFYRFTQNELSVIRAMLACGCEVTVTLCLPDESASETSIFSGAYRSYQAILRLARETGEAVLPPVWLNDSPRYLCESLKTLESALSGARTVSEKDENISLYIAKGKYEEVCHVASAIRSYVAETNTPYRDIAVITGDYDGYADLVSSIFPIYEIPVFADTRHDFLSHPIVLYLFSLFDLLTGITTKGMTAYMKSGFADISPDDAARLENFALSSAIEYDDWLNDDRFLYKMQSIFDPTNPASANTDFLHLKTTLLAPVLALKEKMMASKFVKDRVDALFSFLEEQQFAEKIAEKAKDFEEKGLLRQAEEFTEVYNILVETLDAMTHVLGEETVGLASMRAVLEAGLSQKSIGVIPTVYDQIAFGDLNRSVIKNTRALFVLGANDGIFPPLPQTDVFLSDNEREFLNTQGVHVAPNAGKLITDAEFSVYAAVTSVREKLHISYSLSDSEGRGLRPATFISQVKRTFPSLTAGYEENGAELSADTVIASASSAYNYLLTHIALLGKNETVDRLYETLCKDPIYLEKLRRAKEYAAFCNTPGQLSPDAVKLLYGDTLHGSVSRFERFAACPFSFFMEYGLKAKERKILKMEAPDVGSLLHEIVERFSRRIQEEGKSFRTITPEEQRAMTDSITEEMFSAMHINNIYGARRLESLKNRMKSLVAKSVWALCLHVKRGDFEPTDFEVGFGENEEIPPVTVPLPNGGKIVLSGRIDRIDTLTHKGELYLKIIDYKSGSKAYSLSDIFNGNTLQLAVYMIAASEGAAKASAAPVKFGGMFYFHLDDPVLPGEPADSAEETVALKTYKMTGLVTNKHDIITSMDTEFTGFSPIIPVYVSQSGAVSESRSSIANDAQIEKLKQHILTTVEKIGAEIMKGNVDIYPVRDSNTNPCRYCKYKSVCGFDPDVHPRRKLQKMKDAEIWEVI